MTHHFFDRLEVIQPCSSLKMVRRKTSIMVEEILEVSACMSINLLVVVVSLEIVPILRYV